MALVLVCDECGKPAKGTFGTGTGRVLIDGVDNNLQAADLCKEHWPLDDDPVGEDGFQPHNCKRAKFYWPRAIPAEERGKERYARTTG